MAQGHLPSRRILGVPVRTGVFDEGTKVWIVDDRSRHSGLPAADRSRLVVESVHHFVGHRMVAAPRPEHELGKVGD